MRRLGVVVRGVRRGGVDEGVEEVGLLAEEGGLLEAGVLVVQEGEVEEGGGEGEGGEEGRGETHCGDSMVLRLGGSLRRVGLGAEGRKAKRSLMTISRREDNECCSPIVP